MFDGIYGCPGSAFAEWQISLQCQVHGFADEDLVPVGDRRVRYIGVDAYFAAGGSAPTRDLFEPDDGGWLADPALVDRLVAEKLEADAAAIKAEGWKWVEAMVDLPYGYDEDCRYIEGTLEPPTEVDEARIAELRAEADALEAEWPAMIDRRGSTP